MGCVSQDSYPRKSIPREEGRLGSKHAVKYFKCTWHQIKIRENEVHREELLKSVRLMSVVLARPGLRRGRTPCYDSEFQGFACYGKRF